MVPSPQSASQTTSGGRTVRISLAAKVLLVVLLCVGLPILLTGAFFLQHNHQLLAERSREVLANSVFRKATEIDEWARQRHEEVQRWAASFVVFEGLEGLERPGGNAAAIRGELNDFLRTLLPHHRSYEALLVLDRAGRTVAATRELASGAWLDQVLRGAHSRGTTFTSLAPQTPGQTGWIVSQPVRGHGDAIVGFLVGKPDPREIEALLKSSRPTLGFWLLDLEGHVLARDGRFVDQVPTAFPLAIPLAAEPEHRVLEGELPEIGSVLYSLRALEGPLPGQVVVTLKAEAAYQPLFEARRRLMLWGLSGTFGVLFLAFFAARRVLRPIELLAHAARELSAGGSVMHVPVRGSDELADLTVTFNEMAQRVREARARAEEARDDLARTNLELTDANRALETLAITDGLTGLYNRRHFQDVLEREINRCQRQGGVLSLLLCDLDHFKAYNDRWGHQEGDTELRRVATVMINSIRQSDLAFRYGGEELAVLLNACASEQAGEVAEKIRQAVRAVEGEGRTLPFRGRTTISIGVATFPDHARVARGLIDIADAALYEAKARGRDCVVLAGATPPSPGDTEALTGVS